MLIKIIWLHVSLELPDGDCIGGRLQLESFLSSFYFPYPKKKKKKKEAALVCTGWLCEGCLLLYTVWMLVSNYINAQLCDYIYKSFCFGFFSFTHIMTKRKISLLFRLCHCWGNCNFPIKAPVLCSLLFSHCLQSMQHLEPVKTEDLFFSGLWPLLNTQSPKEGYVLQCVFRKA